MELDKLEVVNALINQVVNKYSHNHHYLVEDLKQELRIWLWEMKERYENLEGNDLKRMVYTIVRNHFLRIISKKSFKVETYSSSSITESYEEENDRSFVLELKECDSPSTEELIFENELQKLVQEYIENCIDEDEKKYLSLCFQPTEELNEYFEKTVESNPSKRLKHRKNIPPLMVGKFLGLNYYKVAKIQNRVKSFLINKGYMLN